MVDDGCGCEEEVRQRWIRQLAAAVVEMQGKEGTFESKGRKGCSDREERGGREMTEAAAAKVWVRCDSKRVKDIDGQRVAAVAR
ncbi:hypothetical protein GW17_00021865 [Ensete ventricosum]|nr:hypothetical protein GW17_00021865 [Ensete ventricosum]RZR97097.1 hypothetical protein BHM03_00026215 [Ensete ventricosum]